MILSNEKKRQEKCEIEYSNMYKLFWELLLLQEPRRNLRDFCRPY